MHQCRPQSCWRAGHGLFVSLHTQALEMHAAAGAAPPQSRPPLQTRQCGAAEQEDGAKHRQHSRLDCGAAQQRRMDAAHVGPQRLGHAHVARIVCWRVWGWQRVPSEGEAAVPGCEQLRNQSQTAPFKRCRQPPLKKPAARRMTPPHPAAPSGTRGQKLPPPPPSPHPRPPHCLPAAVRRHCCRTSPQSHCRTAGCRGPCREGAAEMGRRARLVALRVSAASGAAAISCTTQLRIAACQRSEA